MTDYFGQDASKLRDKKLWLFDMDGTIYNENRLFDGTLELLNRIEELGGECVYVTNNSSKGLTDYVNKVTRLGIEADENSFFTSAQASVHYLKQNYKGKKVYCQGTKSLVNELLDSGIDVTEEVEPVDIVLIGFDTELSTPKLRNTCEILSTQDVVYLATHPDWVCPVSFGYVPDCGSICQMLKNATGKWPKFIGKPEPNMINIAMDMRNRSIEETVVVGDRIYTDITSGYNAGVTTICVLTGESTLDDISKSDIKPTYTFHSVKEILAAIS